MTDLFGRSVTVRVPATSANLGPGFEHGAMIAQDGRSAQFPFRAVDTRRMATCPATLGGGVSSINTIFPKAKALLVSVTVVNASMASYLTAYSGAAQPPAVATLPLAKKA